MAYKSVRLLFREMNDWAVSWFGGRLCLSSKTNMATTPLTGQEAAKKLSFGGEGGNRHPPLWSGSSGALKMWTKGFPQQPERLRWRWAAIDLTLGPLGMQICIYLTCFRFVLSRSPNWWLQLTNGPGCEREGKEQKGQMEGRTTVGKNSQDGSGEREDRSRLRWRRRDLPVCLSVCLSFRFHRA